MNRVALAAALLAVPASLAAVVAGADDPGSGCGIRFRGDVPVALPCPAPARTLDGGTRNGAMPIAGAATPVRVVGSYRVIETWSTSQVAAGVIDGLIAERIGREGIRLKKGGRFEGVTFRNLRLVHAPAPNVPPDLPEGIHIEAGHDILIENATIRGFQMTAAPNSYWNGDGIASEGGVRGVTIRNVAVLDNTDGGLDLKSDNNLLDNVYAAGNKRNVRLWGNTRATTLAIGPVNRRGGAYSTAGIWIRGGAARPVVTIDTLIVDMGRAAARDTPGLTAVIQIEDGPADVHVGRCIVRSMPADLAMVRASPGSNVTLGQGCPR